MIQLRACRFPDDTLGSSAGCLAKKNNGSCHPFKPRSGTTLRGHQGWLGYFFPQEGKLITTTMD